MLAGAQRLLLASTLSFKSLSSVVRRLSFVVCRSSFFVCRSSFVVCRSLMSAPKEIQSRLDSVRILWLEPLLFCARLIGTNCFVVVCVCVSREKERHLIGLRKKQIKCH